MTFNEILSEALSNVEGIAAVSLTGMDGIGVETLIADPGDEGFESEVVEVEIAGLMVTAAKTLKALGGGAVKELIVEGEKRSYFASRLEHDYMLILVLAAGGNLGRARLEGRKVAQKLRDNM
jgi:predicted regulator of Ras-like GTPase activity (Roadblock/LC7/MglB family)